MIELAGVLALLYALEKTLKRTPLIFVFYFLSTLPHELAHFLVAFILGGRPSLPSFIPKKVGTYWILGEVRFTPNVINAFPSALAPLLLIPLAFLLLSSPLPFPLKELLFIFLLKGSLPSIHDLKILILYPYSTLLWLVILLLLLKLFDEKLILLIKNHSENFFPLPYL